MTQRHLAFSGACDVLVCGPSEKLRFKTVTVIRSQTMVEWHPYAFFTIIRCLFSFPRVLYLGRYKSLELAETPCHLRFSFGGEEENNICSKIPIAIAHQTSLIPGHNYFGCLSTSNYYPSQTCKTFCPTQTTCLTITLLCIKKGQ